MMPIAKWFDDVESGCACRRARPLFLIFRSSPMAAGYVWIAYRLGADGGGSAALVSWANEQIAMEMAGRGPGHFLLLGYAVDGARVGTARVRGRVDCELEVVEAEVDPRPSAEHEMPELVEWFIKLRRDDVGAVN